MTSPHLPSRILLIDRATEMVAAWRERFDDREPSDESAALEVIEGDYFSRPADAIASPANSFGIMDGGLDLAIRNALGFEVQREVQRVILERHHGELPVGQAEVVATGHERWPYLIVAPTMRVPESAARTLNAYLAFRAILLAARRFNELSEAKRIDSIVCCGLGTGIGAMGYRRCATQMRMAFDQITGPARIPSSARIHAIHGALLRS